MLTKKQRNAMVSIALLFCVSLISGATEAQSKKQNSEVISSPTASRITTSPPANRFMMSCCETRGDVNDDGVVDFYDFVMAVALPFHWGFPIPECDEQADADSSGSYDNQDANPQLLKWIFKDIGHTANKPPACP